HAHGAGEEHTCGGWAWQGLYALVPAAALLVFGLALVAEPLFARVGTSPELREHALAYLAMRPIGMTGLAVWVVIAAFVRGLGDTRTPLVATLVANAVNVALDYGLVLGRLGLPAWGIAGAGVATSIAEWVGASLLAVAFARRGVRRYGTRFQRPSARRIRRFLRTGAPIGGQWLPALSAFALFTALVARMGDAAMAASQAMIALLALSFMQAMGVGLAATTLVGRYKGAGDLVAAERSHRSARALVIALAAGIAALFLLAPET